MASGNAMTVWCEPTRRGDLKVAPGDIAAALTWFKESTGKDARLISLHPKNERCAKECGEGVEVEYVSGCLAWEVWLSAGDIPVPCLPHVDHAVEPTLACDKTQVMPIPIPTHMARLGRPPLDLPLETILELASQGFSCRDIATKLSGEGTMVSYRSVARTTTRLLQAALPIARVDEQLMPEGDQKGGNK
ncbi:MAG: hypothetical protein NTU41_05755 [Chloroflexi bacterium]|nr:hypothetical protein [Chloroflexota bacterium]